MSLLDALKQASGILQGLSDGQSSDAVHGIIDMLDRQSGGIDGLAQEFWSQH